MMNCEVCQGEIIYPNNDSSIEIYQGGLIITTGLEGYNLLGGFDFEINYCPICGKKLDDASSLIHKNT